MVGIIKSIMGCCGDKSADKPLQEEQKGGTASAPGPSKAAGGASKALSAPGTVPSTGPVLDKPAPGAKTEAKDPPPAQTSSQPYSDPKPLEIADANTKVIAKREPYDKKLEVGKVYYYCTCGRSANQPFCDGKHAGTAFVPKAFTAEKIDAYLCGCKATKKEPNCDGSHLTLKW